MNNQENSGDAQLADLDGLNTLMDLDKKSIYITNMPAASSLFLIPGVCYETRNGQSDTEYRPRRSDSYVKVANGP